jgi:phosphatidylglycerol:prolipoprotein diacylglycerol transferase
MRPGSGRRMRALNPIQPFAVQRTQSSPAAGGGFAGLIASAQHEVLAVTVWFEPAPYRKSDSVSIRLSGQRVGVVGPLKPGDRFEQDEKVEGVVAGSGPISVTARVFGINPGEWAVTAKMLGQLSERPRPKGAKTAPTTEAVYPAQWSWRHWKLSKGSAAVVKTTWLPFIRVPGVIPGFWAATAGLGIVVALATQAAVLSRSHLRIDNAVVFSLLAIGLGIVGAKVWFVVLRRRERRVEGWCIQGLLVGVVVASAIGFTALHMPVGTLLDATAPGLFFGMAIGRLGCFFGGCCAGRPTRSRWGLWSVLDQRVGMRRIPTQFVESLLAFCVGLIALAAVLTRGTSGGAIFVAGIAAYILIRQGVLRLRGGVPKSLRITQLTAMVAAVVLAADLLVMTLDPALRFG